MGCFSEPAIQGRREEREPSYPSRIDTLQYFLEDLGSKLDALDAERPHDPMDPCWDQYFRSDCIARYYENPGTVQDVLFCIAQRRYVQTVCCSIAASLFSVDFFTHRLSPKGALLSAILE